MRGTSIVAPVAAAVVALGIAAGAPIARAQPAQPQPWSVGVSDAKKQEAQRYLEEGNAEFLERKYPAALAKYEQAIAAWNHPAIRFNIVRCLIQLDRPVDAYDNLKLALAYGAAPLEDAVYTEALAYEKLLANQIAEVAIACTQPGVAMALDGQPLGACPRTEQRRVTPGPHLVVGAKPGFLTRTIDVVAVGGQRQEVALVLEPLASAARIEHRWPGWIPWVVFGGGFAVAGVGGAINLAAASNMDSYDRTVTQLCSRTPCTAAQLEAAGVAGLDRKAERQSVLGVGVMILGGATVATGAVLLYLNRGRTVYPERADKLAPAIAPVEGGGATLTLGGVF